RRHTSSKRDWSSDVCSSDLGVDPGDILFFGIGANVVAAAGAFLGGLFDDRFGPKRIIVVSLLGLLLSAAIVFVQDGTVAFWIWEIGRASCRDVVEVVGGHRV